LPLAIAAGGFLVRLFAIQHDCSHGAFFRHRLANDWIGRVAGVLTFTPYGVWRHAHATHHATTGNLDRRGLGDVDTLTVEEYRSRSFWGRLRYRLYRHPLVMFGIGPAYLFILQHRLPVGLRGWRPWASTMTTNLVIASLVALMIWLIGLKAFLLVHLPIMLLAATAGVWLFYVQHQFEGGIYWERHSHWDPIKAALEGSSYYKLPKVLQWFSGNIGLHHIHHLRPGIPNYNLQRCQDETPALHAVKPLTLLESFRSLFLHLWDETDRKLVGFRVLRTDA
jgi:omega-6 fatty acid desaturase (delta-12 desaturase)